MFYIGNDALNAAFWKRPFELPVNMMQQITRMTEGVYYTGSRIVNIEKIVSIPANIIISFFQPSFEPVKSVFHSNSFRVI